MEKGSSGFKALMTLEMRLNRQSKLTREEEKGEDEE